MESNLTLDNRVEIVNPGEDVMNWDQIEGNWKQFKGEVQKKWGKFTDNELDQIDGNRTKLAGKIQEKYGKSKEEAEEMIDKWND